MTGDAHHPALPSIHLRVAITWLSIFPFVTFGMTLMSLIGPVASLPVWLRALLLTAMVVPTSMYVVVPRLLALVVRWTPRTRRGRASNAAEDAVAAG
ncbi:hypothetical protein ACFYVR_05190 [Rhodococcus sp. NPDC003318]|uniref:hypothetical protein n=1 Tax=Rhodococcus sp. NPDC003318 TaxID=3364503 RepID=UPI00369EC6AB